MKAFGQSAKVLVPVFLTSLALVSCGNRVNLKSVGTIDLDSMMREVDPLVILTIYQNEVLPDKYQEVYSVVADEMADNANTYNWLIGDELDILGIDQDTYERGVEEMVNKSYSIAWENIQYIVNNHVLKEDFPMEDIDDQYAKEFIEYYFETIDGVESRVVLSDPVLVKDEEGYATFTVTNTITNVDYLIRLADTDGSDVDGSEYYIEVSEL